MDATRETLPSSTMYNEQYQIAVYIFCFSLAFFGFLPGGAGILFTDTLEPVRLYGLYDAPRRPGQDV
jgi:hypothetical protein